MTAARITADQPEGRRHHPQEPVTADPHHPQTRRAGGVGDPEHHADAHPRHPQRERPAPTPAGGGLSRRGGERPPLPEPDGPDDRSAPSTQRRCAADPPSPGALRPLARALLSVAAEVHAKRREVRRATCPAQETTLRMGNRGLRHPVRSPGVSGLVPPATPERTGSQDASLHAEAAGGPPVENPDCIGECA